MKTTIKLPDEIMRKIKIRAEREGRTISAVIADVLAQGLNVADETVNQPEREIFHCR